MTDEHARVEELLSAMQDGAATPEEVGLVERHLATCARCRATATAYRQVDRQVRHYLMATPVPEIATPWRNEPLVVVAPRQRGNLGHWRITAAGLALIFVLLLAGTALTFINRDANPAVTQSSGGMAMAGTATRETSVAFAAPSAAASAAPASAALAGGQAPNVPRSAAASALPSAAASAAAPAAAAATPATGDLALINPARVFRLETATTLVICRPACDEQAQAPEVLRRVVAALDRGLSPAPPVPPSTVRIPYVTLRFALADGQLIDIGYYAQLAALQLPDGRGLVAAPPDLVAALAGVVQR